MLEHLLSPNLGTLASSGMEGKGHLAFLPLTPTLMILSDVKVTCDKVRYGFCEAQPIYKI